MMLKRMATAAFLFVASASTGAHEIWIERGSDTGPVEIFFGEPADPAPDHGQDEIRRIVKPRVFGADGKAATSLAAGADRLTAALAQPGDAWLFDDTVFEPYAVKDGKFEAVAYHARAGRSLAETRLDFEFMPDAPGADSLVLIFRERAMPNTPVTVISPAHWQKTFRTDSQGRLVLPALESGRYIVTAAHREPVQREIAGRQVSAVYHVATLTFSAP